MFLDWMASSKVDGINSTDFAATCVANGRAMMEPRIVMVVALFIVMVGAVAATAGL